LSEPDLLHIIGDASPSLLVYDNTLDSTIESLKKKTRLNRYLAVGGDPGWGGGLEELASGEAPTTVKRGLASLDDLCMLVYTSGTAGLPKGVMLTHSNLTWNVYNMLHAAEFTQQKITLAWAPLFRLGGLAVTVLETLQAGGRVVIVSQANPQEVLRVMESFISERSELVHVMIPRWTHNRIEELLIAEQGAAEPENYVVVILEGHVPRLNL
jgi:fatty-acyl-CoA synthase